MLSFHSGVNAPRGRVAPLSFAASINWRIIDTSPMSANRSLTPEEYADFIRSIEDRIRAAQVKAGLAVNRELVLLYWGIGKEISQRQQERGNEVTRSSSRLQRIFKSSSPA